MLAGCIRRMLLFFGHKLHPAVVNILSLHTLHIICRTAVVIHQVG